MKKDSFNDIGIRSDLDEDRITHLLKVGIFGCFLALAGDIILGWGTCDLSLSGFDRYFSRYLNVSDVRIFLAATLGLIGIPIECLSYFAIYRLIASGSKKEAHRYRSGIIGILIFGALVHVLCCATVYYGKQVYLYDPGNAAGKIKTFGLCFLLPAMILFLVFFLYAAIIQIRAFSKGLTPCPKSSWIYNYLFGMIAVILLKFFGNRAFAYALSTGWISIGSLWMMCGLYRTMKKEHGTGNND